MIKILRKILGDAEKTIKERTFNLMLLYVVVSAVFASIFFVQRGMSAPLIVVLLLVAISMAVIFLLQKKYGNLQVFSIIVVGLINIVFLPFLFLFGGGLKSGMPMIFVAGYLVTYFMLDGMVLLIAVFLISCWDCLVMTHTFYAPDYVQISFGGIDLLFDIIICLIVAAVVSTLVWIVYHEVYNKVHYNLMDASKRIEQAGIVKSRFLANMSHELRTPMNAILGMSELLEKTEGSSDIAYEAGLIRESAYSLLTTINNVLSYSKLDSKKDYLILNQFRFSQLLSDVIYSVNMELVNKPRVTFFASVDPDIPDLLYGDDVKIRKILSYVIFAAIRNTDEGRINLIINHNFEKKNNAVTLNVSISDTGYGLSDDEQESIFTSYERYDTRKDSQLRRVGLELTICRYLVEMMNGEININTIENVGSVVSFNIRLFSVERKPIVDKNNLSNTKVLVFATMVSRINAWSKLIGQFSLVPDIVNSYVGLEAALKDRNYDVILIPDYSYNSLKGLISSYSLAEKTYVITDLAHSYGDFDECRLLRRPIYSIPLGQVLNGKWKKEDYIDVRTRESFVAPTAKVLVVDDNIVNVKVAQSILKEYEINTFISTSGRDAIEKIKTTKFDLVLLDQMMPEMDGIETLRQIRELSDLNARNVPVVCLTANIGEDVKEELLKSGFQDYLAKPIKIRYLEEVLRTYISSDMIVSKKVKDTENANDEGDNAVTQDTTQTVTNTSDKPSSDGEKTDMSAFPPGLTEERGLMQMGGDQSTYNLILNTYYKDCGEKLHTIPKMFEEGDIKLYSITVHAVKGSSASIGALEVSELFRQLEMASKGGDLEFCKNNMPHALEKLEEILGIIKDYLINKNDFTDPNAEVNITSENDTENNDVTDNQNKVSTDNDSNEFDISLLARLVTEIDRINFDESDRIIDELVTSDYGSEINEKVTKIKNAYDDFDYVTVKEIVKEMQG